MLQRGVAAIIDGLILRRCNWSRGSGVGSNGGGGLAIVGLQVCRLLSER